MDDSYRSRPMRRCKDAALRFVALAQAADDNVLLMNSHMHAQIALHHLGEFEAAAAHSAAVSVGAGRASIRERPDHHLRSRRGLARRIESQFTDYRTLAAGGARCQRGADTGARAEHPDSLAFAHFFEALIAWRENRVETCAPVGREPASQWRMTVIRFRPLPGTDASTVGRGRIADASRVGLRNCQRQSRTASRSWGRWRCRSFAP